MEEISPAAVVAPALSGAQKAAILLVTLGEQASAEIIKQLTDAEVKAVTRAIAEMNVISAQQSEQVLEEFYQATVSRDYPHRGGADYAKRVLLSAFGRDGSGRLVSEMELDPGKPDSSKPLLHTDPKQLAKLIENEHPQTIALILVQLGQQQAAALLATLRRELRSDVAMRIATLDQVSPELIRKITSVLSQKVKSIGEVKREPLGGIRSMAEILNKMENTACEEILEDIREQRDTLEEEIRQNMLVFDDLMLMDTKGIKELVAKVDRKLLIVGLKGTSDQLKTHILSCMSQRGADMVREDMEALGPVKIKEVEAAQQQIIGIVRMMESEGIISLKGGEEEQYVL